MQAGTPPGSTAILALADGTIFRGRGFGAHGVTTGELVFNTAMTGYQEILSDPSYAGQIVTFTFPHVGIVGVNHADTEAEKVAACGLVVRDLATLPSNWRAEDTLNGWCERHKLIGISGIDTRRLTHHLRQHGAQNAALSHVRESGDNENGRIDALCQRARDCAGLNGMDLVPRVTQADAPARAWSQGDWDGGHDYQKGDGSGPHIVVIDYGVKHNILRMLAMLDCRVTVMPPGRSAPEILALEPDGIVLANGPGDPAATGAYAAPVIRELVDSGKPIFGICLGHQMLGLAAGARTEKMPFGHHGANHPVKDLLTGRVEITSQNHGFAIADDNLPDNIEVTHRSLFDGTIQGLRLKDKPVFSVQYHPEASPGPTDSRYLFQRLLQAIQDR